MSADPADDAERLSQHLGFIVEIDRLKGVLRRSLVADGSRRENSAEHSWHLATMAWSLREYAPAPLELSRVLAMALIHDLVEIDAGDTFVYGDGVADQAAREQQAAERIFALLPEPRRGELWELWRELEAGRTPEARYVRVVDRLQPLLLHEATGGAVWQEHGVRRSQVLRRMSEVEQHAPRLWPVVRRIIDDAVARGALRED